MIVVVTAEKFAHCPCLLAETVHTNVWEFWQPVLASIAPVQYLSSAVCLFPVDQPHQRFLTLMDIAVYPPVRMRPMVSGLRKCLRNNLLHAEANVMAFRNTSMLPTLINSRVNTLHACRKTVTSSWRYVSNPRLLSITAPFFFRIPYQARKSFHSDLLLSLAP